jgi:MerR family transcriptional regulator, light-induced transcriptional regulator
MDRAEAHRDAFLRALVERDSTAARRAIDDALAGGLIVDEIYVDVMQPALYEIGHRWALGDLNVAQEHYATTLAQSLLETLSASRLRRPPDGRLALVTATPDELHTLGARMLADFLEADGWEALLLGAGPPVRDVVELVDLERPDVVALSTSTAGVLPGVVELAGALSELRPRPLIVVGGRFWTAETRAAAHEFGADLVVQDAREAVAALRERVPPQAAS